MPRVRDAQRLKNQPRRFPRYARGEDAGKALEKIWRLPRFSVHSGRESTDFKFQLPFSIAKELKRRNLAVYCRLFPNGKQGWANALANAYGIARDKGKPVKSRIGFLLKKVVVEAVARLLEKHKEAFQQDQAMLSEAQESLRKTVIKTGPAIDDRKLRKTAIRLAKRYDELLPQVKELRKFIEESEASLNDSALRTAIDRAFQYPWIKFITNGCAMKNFPSIPGYDSAIEWDEKREEIVMQIWRETIRVLDAAPGADVRINVIAIKPTSGEETQSLELMRSLEPCDELDCVASDGTSSPQVFRPCTLSLFAGRVFTAFQGADEEQFMVLTVEVAGLLVGAKMDSFRIGALSNTTTPPSSQNPCTFRVSRGEMNGLRCVGILTSDGQRAMTFACRRGNIMSDRSDKCRLTR